MSSYVQIISMQSYLKKVLLPLFVIFVLFAFFTFGGANYMGKYLSSLSSVITAWVTINPLEVNVSAPQEVEIGKVFKIEAKVINKGEEKIENAEAEIIFPSGLTLLKKDLVQRIGVIPGKKEKKASWSVKGEEMGEYIVLVLISGELRGYEISAQDNIMVEVKESSRGPQPRNWFQNLFDFFQKWF